MIALRAYIARARLGLHASCLGNRGVPLSNKSGFAKKCASLLEVACTVFSVAEAVICISCHLVLKKCSTSQVLLRQALLSFDVCRDASRLASTSTNAYTGKGANAKAMQLAIYLEPWAQGRLQTVLLGRGSCVRHVHLGFMMYLLQSRRP